ncbi:MAG: glutamate--tRNA ligase [Patescibacteria group bacterium]
MIKVRIPPSPTGNLHIGNARSFLFNWIFAKSQGGEVILRIEDTDLERSKKEYEEDIISGLKWLGITWDNPHIYRQSERLDIYEKYLKQLLDSGKAFWCGHTKEDLEKENKEQRAKGEGPRHICEHKHQGASSKYQGKGIIRLKVDENSTRIIHFDDEIRGTIEWEERLIGDLSLAKDERTPLYNFAVVADDIDMEISHVIRGEDHISNTPKQILIYEALRQAQGKPLKIQDSKFKIPTYAHLPLILGTDRSKLSKRHGATAVSEYRKDYLPESMISFLGSLGFTYSKEMMSKEEMVKEFDLKKVHKSGAVFDVKKLNWINSQYIKSLPASQLLSLPAFEKVPEKAMPLITERLEKLSDVKNFDYFWSEPQYDAKLLNWKSFSKDEIKKSLEETLRVLESWDWEDKDALRLLLDDLGKKQVDRGLVYWPFRVALTGKEKSPDPVDIAFVLEKEKTLKRVENAVNKL